MIKRIQGKEHTEKDPQPRLVIAMRNPQCIVHTRLSASFKPPIPYRHWINIREHGNGGLFLTEDADSPAQKAFD